MNGTEGNHLRDLKPIIASHRFLDGMKAEDLDLLARHAREVEFGPGEVIFRQNEAAYEFFLILEGQVTVESYLPRAENISLQVIGAGDVLGWSWLFPPFTWHFQARALKPTKAIVIDGASLVIACQNDSGLAYWLMERIAQVMIRRLQAARKGFAQFYAEDGSSPEINNHSSSSNGKTALVSGDLPTMLAAHPFFKGMRSEYLKILAQAAMETEFHAGQMIFKEGGIANRFYLIQRGKVIIESPTSDGAPIPIQVIGDGDVLGWSWLFPPFYWHFDARTVERTQCIFIYGTRLREQCEADHEFGYDLMKRVCHVLIARLQATRRQLLSFRDSERYAPLETS